MWPAYVMRVLSHRDHRLGRDTSRKTPAPADEVAVPPSSQQRNDLPAALGQPSAVPVCDKSPARLSRLLSNADVHAWSPATHLDEAGGVALVTS